jgi:alanyl-tRNA synthetase
LSDEEASEILERVEDALGSDAIASVETDEDVEEALAQWLDIDVEDLSQKWKDAIKVKDYMKERAEELREEEEEIELPPEEEIEEIPKPITERVTKAVSGFVKAVSKILGKLKFW